MSTAPRSRSRSRNRGARLRMKRWSLGLDEATRANLRARAAAHGVSQAAYVRAVINGHRPGSEPGSAAAAADTWWDSRSPARRESIHRNHAIARDDTLSEDQPSLLDPEESP